MVPMGHLDNGMPSRLGLLPRNIALGTSKLNKNGNPQISIQFYPYCRTHNLRVCLYIAYIAYGSASLYIKTLYFFFCTLNLNNSLVLKYLFGPLIFLN